MEIKSELILPFKLPIKDGLSQASKYPFAELHVTFDSIEASHDLELNNVDVLRSKLSISYFPLDEMKSEKDFTIVAKHFLLACIFHINKLVNSIKIVYGTSYLYPITIYDLPKKILVTITNGESRTNVEYLTDGKLFQNETLIHSAKDFSKVGAVLSSMDIYPELFDVDVFYESAKSALHKERFTNFIVDIQTSFEIFIRNTHRLILIQEGKTETEINKAAEFPFRNVIEDHLSKYLKEVLTFEENPYILDWNKHIYRVRNQIVHNGLQIIDGSQAYQAIDAYENARKYISDLLVKEGYLNGKGNVDLNLFKKNEFDLDASEELIRNMKEKGLIDKELPIIQSSKYK